MRAEPPSTSTSFLRDVSWLTDVRSQSHPEKATATAAPPPQSAASDGIERVASELEAYGKWCGPNYGTDGDVPIDNVDKACMAHDIDYHNRGYFDVWSDLKLDAKQLKNLVSPQSTLKERLAAAGILFTFGFVTPLISVPVTTYRGVKAVVQTAGEVIARGAKAAGGAIAEGAKAAGNAVASGAKATWHAVTSWF